jgi:hypothetical protein
MLAVERKTSTRLGQILLEKGLLTAEQLNIAIKEQSKRRQHIDPANGDLDTHTPLGEILIELGFITHLQLKRGLNWQLVLRKMAIVMSFCAPLMTASYSVAAATAGAFAQPTFMARSSTSSVESKQTPSFTKSSSSASSAPSNNSEPGSKVVPNNVKSSSSSSKSSVAPNKTTGPDLTAPQLPNKISVTSALYDRVHLSWIAATDNVEVTRYRIYRDQIQIDVLEGDKTEFVDFNVAPGKNYLYGVSAGDAVGNWSAIKSVFVLTAAAPAGIKVVSSSSASSVASSSNSSVASSSSKAPSFTQSSSRLASVAPSSSASSLSSKASSSSIAPSSSKSSSSTSNAVSSSSSSKAAVSSSSISSISSSAASSASSVAGSVNLNWTPPVARENGDVLDITEVGGYELRYRKVADNAYTYVTINDAWTNTYNFAWLEGNYVFQIAAFDKNGMYSGFVDLIPH